MKKIPQSIKEPLSKNRSLASKTYRSWDVFTQAKFIFEINKQAGTPASKTQASKTAIEAVLQTNSR